MKTLITLAALFAAGSAQAVAPVAPAQPAAKPAAPAPAAAPRKMPGVSDAGNAVLAKAQTTPDPMLQQLGQKARTAHDQLMSAVMAPQIDLDKVAAAMKAENDVQNQARDHTTDRLIGVLKDLPPEDRGTFLRTLILAQQQRAQQQRAGAPAAAATPKP